MANRSPKWKQSYLSSKICTKISVQNLNSRGVTILHFVPSMLQYFLSELATGGSVPSLRSVFTSGEALPYETVEKFYKLVDGSEYITYTAQQRPL